MYSFFITKITTTEQKYIYKPMKEIRKCSRNVRQRTVCVFHSCVLVCSLLEIVFTSHRAKINIHAQHTYLIPSISSVYSFDCAVL